MPVKQFRSAGPMTLNNYTQDELAHLRAVSSAADTKIKYITWNEEVGQEGTPHLQIYAQAFTKLSVAGWHKALGQRIANIVPAEHPERAQKYCQGFKHNSETDEYEAKPGSSKMEEYGTTPAQGQRNDLHMAREEVMKRPLAEIMLESDHVQAIASHYTFFKDLDMHAQADRAFKAARADHNTFMGSRVKQPWESVLDGIVNSAPCTRSIHWFVDTIGETGKTCNAKSLYFNHNAFYCTGGKSADIAHAYQYQPIVVFNLVASQDKDTSVYLYKVLEEFKDGIFSSGKYQSMVKAFPIPHVIVFSNDVPDESKMKKSRLVVHNIQRLNAPAAPGNYLQEALARKAGKLVVAPYMGHEN